MKILMIRHGQAEDRDLGKADELRELTQEGIEELENNAGYLALYLRDESVRLIASPLRRSLMTAEILTRAGLGEARAMDFVATGNFGTLKRMVKASPETTHVIVGHSPHLEDWIFAITNQWLEMKKGACALIEISDETDFTGFVTWYLPIHKYNRLIKLGSFRRLIEELAADIEAIIEKYHQVILDHREDYLKEPAEIESVHKLRVKIRQFRSLVSFFKPLMPRKRYRQIQDILREMAQECAYLRELDVLMKEWLSLKPEFLKAGLTGESFLEIMREERGKEQDRLFAFLEKPDFAKDLAKAAAMLRNSIDAEESPYLKLADMVEDTLDIWHDEIKAEYDAIEVNNLEIIHALRIRAKKMRYIMEVFELDEAAGSKAMYKEIKRWQEVLGNITDANRNSEAVMEIAGLYPEAPIQAELELFKAIQAREADLLYEEFFGTLKSDSVKSEDLEINESSQDLIDGSADQEESAGDLTEREAVEPER